MRPRSSDVAVLLFLVVSNACLQAHGQTTHRSPTFYPSTDAMTVTAEKVPVLNEMASSVNPFASQLLSGRAADNSSTPGNETCEVGPPSEHDEDNVCCDVSIMNLLHPGSASSTHSSSKTGSGGKKRQSSCKGDAEKCCHERIVDLMEGVTTIKQVIFKASGIAGSGEQQTSGDYKTSTGWQVVQFKTKPIDTNDAFNLTSTVFAAPVAGYYAFNLGLYCPDDHETKSCIALGLVNTTTGAVRRTSEQCFEPGASGAVGSVLTLAAGDQVTAVFHGAVGSKPWDHAEDVGGLRFAEFSGTLLALTE